MKAKHALKSISLALSIGVLVGCPQADANKRLANLAQLPLPFLTAAPLGSTTPHPTQTSLVDPPPSLRQSPLPTPLPIQTEQPPPLATLPPTAWIEGYQGGDIRIVERSDALPIFFNELRSVSVESSHGVQGTFSVTVRIKEDIPSEMNAYVERHNRHGSFDHIGPVQIDATASRVAFTASASGDYSLVGRETYAPPENVDIALTPPIQESLALDPYDIGYSIASIRSAQLRKITSVPTGLHVRNYLNEKKFVLRPVILCLHGMGERNPPKLWANSIAYLKGKAVNREQLRGVVFSIPTYDTLQAVHVAKERVKQRLLATIGSAPIIIMCHSMGCEVARDLAADPEMKDMIIGGVMLAAANGSPWIPKKRMRPSIADQPDATALLTAQTIALAKVMPNIIEAFSSSRSLTSLVQSLDERVVSKGALSLATARDDIPERSYWIHFNIGIYPSSFRETLSPDDAYTLPCSDQYFPQPPRNVRIRHGSCVANFAGELRRWEREQGLDMIPRWYAYAGYYRGSELRNARQTFLRRLASAESVALILSNASVALDEEALKFAASLLTDRITKDGSLKRFSDGLVDPEDSWLLDDGPSLESIDSRRDNLLIDWAVVAKRLPRDIIRARAFLRSHRQIVWGLSPDDGELFGSLAQDVGSLLEKYRSQSTSFADSELAGIRDEIEKIHHTTQGVYDTAGKTTGLKTTTVRFAPAILCGDGLACVDLPYDVVQIYDDWRYNSQTTTLLSKSSRRAYRVWRTWRLFDD